MKTLATANEPTIKERPILFSGPMVRAILDGRKTQTRRVVKPQPTSVVTSVAYLSPVREFHWLTDSETWDMVGNWFKCPYGKPGDRLWVRETFNRTNPGGKSGIFYYKAANGFPWGEKYSTIECWKPSIHMPRCASRINLEITNVRVERLQDISEEDAKAEGIEPVRHHDGIFWNNYQYTTSADIYRAFKKPVRSFESLWNSINGSDAWAANPWVWVIEFRRIA